LTKIDTKEGKGVILNFSFLLQIYYVFVMINTLVEERSYLPHIVIQKIRGSIAH